MQKGTVRGENVADKTEKTNSMRLLESKKVPYSVHRYSAERLSAEEVAALVDKPPEQVFKTLVVVPPRGKALLAIVPANHELDLKKLAQAAGEKKVQMATQKEAESLTGLQVGGISALALTHKGFRVFLDASARSQQTILVSAGQRGIQLELGPDDLSRVTNAQVADIARPVGEE
jgi:Cys-tRNA(Pro)/Cys-tRNA(Cys) deacylase